MPTKTTDPISPWFIAAEELGEFIGIRFGRLTESGEPEWEFLPHTNYDGIGGLAEILRKRGATLHRLPQIKHYSNSSWVSLVRSLPKYVSPRRRLIWDAIDGTSRQSTSKDSPTAVAWHAFDEGTTTQMRRICRKAGV